MRDSWTRSTTTTEYDDVAQNWINTCISSKGHFDTAVNCCEIVSCIGHVDQPCFGRQGFYRYVQLFIYSFISRCKWLMGGDDVKSVIFTPLTELNSHPTVFHVLRCIYRNHFKTARLLYGIGYRLWAYFTQLGHHQNGWIFVYKVFHISIWTKLQSKFLKADWCKLTFSTTILVSTSGRKSCLCTQTAYQIKFYLDIST